MTVGELKEKLKEYEDDVEVCVEGEAGMCYEVASTYDDEARPGRRGLFLEAGNQLAPL